MRNAEEAIKRVKNFLKNLIHMELDFIDNCDFSNPFNPYYIYMDTENRGCFESKQFFIDKSNLNKLIIKQFINNKYG